jgi:AraC-like DNA-binding protein
MYLQCRPGPVLAPYVEWLWCCEGYPATHRRERVLPSGRVQLILDLAASRAPSLVVGIHTGYGILETASLQSVMGVAFHPGGARPFFDAPADALSNQEVPLDLVWHSLSALRERLWQANSPAARLRILEAELIRRLHHSADVHPAVRFALAEFRGDPRAIGISQLARDAGLSRRRLSGLFREQVGLPPKLYCRLLRFQHVVRCISSGASVDWADVSIAGGYYDQAHMAHEFREFSGLAPSSWLASERPFQNHVVLD